MNYVVTKQMKSRGVAALLVFLFGGFGIFYSSIIGGLIMGIIAPLAVIIAFLFGLVTGSKLLITLLIIFCCLYYIICFVWTIRAVESYNNKILREANLYNQKNNYEVQSNNSFFNVPAKNNNRQEIKDSYQDLERINSLRFSKVITEEQYNKQKENILNKIEQLKHTNILPNNSSTNVQTTSYNNNSKNKIWIWLLILLLIFSLMYVLYDSKTNSLKFDKITSLFSSHSTEKEEIKNQLEKAYFNVLNGSYTAQAISGSSSDGLPFYNTNVKSLLVMGLSPIANFTGNLKIEPSNIGVYEFSDANTAKIRYDLSLITANDTIRRNVDMVAKKIGGLWKFDAEKFFGFDKKGNSKTGKTNSETKTAKLLYTINEKLFDNILSKNSSYEAITDTDEINNLLTKNLKNKLNIDKSPSFLTEDYRFFNIGIVKYKNFNLQFFIYLYQGGLGEQQYAQINVCNQSGIILDTKEIGKFTYDEELDNYYSITTGSIDENGIIISKNETQEGTGSKKRYKTEKYSISEAGKIVKI